MKIKFILIIAFNLIHSSGSTQIITSIAGNGIGGYSGDNGLATAASISESHALVTDKSGNIYFPDLSHNVIRKINSNGIITTIAGTGIAGYSGDGGLAINAKLTSPSWMTIDQNGNIYFVDQQGILIRKIDFTGIITTIAGKTQTAPIVIDGSPAFNSFLGSISGIEVDQTGNLFISDSRHIIRKINNVGIISTIAGKISGGSGGFSGDNGPALDAEFSWPYGIHIDKDGNIYIPDSRNHRIRKINTSGKVSTIAGNGLSGFVGDAGLAVNAQLSFPISVKTDQFGNIYIADQLNNRIRKIDNAGIITTVAGNGTYGSSGDGGPAIDAKIATPWDVEIDLDGNIIFPSGQYDLSSIKKVSNCFQIQQTVSNGLNEICVGSNIIVSNATPNGMWSSDNNNIASIEASGKITGINPGKTIINYTVTNGSCIVKAPITITVLSKPSLSPISGDSEVCDGGSLKLNINSTDGIWESNNLSVATIDITGKVSGLSAGIAKISYQSINSCGISKQEKTIIINPNPIVQDITGPSLVCEKSNNQYSNQSLGGIWSTSNSNGVINQLGTLNAISAGTITINYTLTNLGCTSAKSKLITIGTLPDIPPISGNDKICLNSSIQFTNAVLGGVWSSSNASIISVNQSGIVNSNNLGNATISYTYNTISCGTTSVSKEINVHPLPIPAFNIPTICLPNGEGYFENNTTISDNSESTLSYLWNFGDNSNLNTSNIKSPSHKFSTLGLFNIKLLVTSINGCQDSITQTITSIYNQPKVDFQISKSEICLGQDILLFDKSYLSNLPIKSYYWNFGNGDSSFIKNPIYYYRDSGIYNIGLYFKDIHGCLSDTAIKQIQIYNYPKLGVEKNYNLLEGGSLAFQPKFYYGNELKVKWTPSIYLNNSNIISPIITPTENMIYTITLTNKGGCSISDSVKISILKTPVIPNVFSPNGDGINDKWKIQYLDTYLDADIKVYNRYGQIVYYSQGYKSEWDGTNKGKMLPVATYFYIIDPKNGRQSLSGSVTIIK